MGNYEAVRLSLTFFLILSPTILSKSVDHEGNKDENHVATSLSSSWSKIKSILHAAQMTLYPPNLDFRNPEESITGHDVQGGGSSTKEKVKERMKMAVEKSVEEGEMTMEETAQSAAKLMGEAMHKAKDKVEHKMSKRHAEEL